jgi:DNA modification methylase
MTVTVIEGDVRARLAELPDESVHCVVTSPPYWGLRDYGTAAWIGGDPDCDHRSPTMRAGRDENRPMLAGSAATNSGQLRLSAAVGVCGVCGARRVDSQLGLEPTPQEHVAAMVGVFREVRRVLRKDGVCWVNYGDSYAGSTNGRSAADTKALGNDDRTFRDKPFGTATGGLKPKDLCGVPFRFALAMQDDGWWWRSCLPWVKRNGMPESIKDRPATAVEYVFMFTRSPRYWYDAAAVRRHLAPASVDRLAQDVESQASSLRANGGRKTNGTMKAVRGRGTYGRHTLDVAIPAAERRDHEHSPGHMPPHRGLETARQDWKMRQRGVPPRHAQHESSDQSDLDQVDRGERNFRNADLFFESLEGPRGLLTDADGAPLALDVPPQPFRDAHFATFPPNLIRPLILAGCPKDGTVLDPFFGAGTTGMVADRLQRHCIGIELNPAYASIARGRIEGDAPLLTDVQTSKSKQEAA